MSDTNFVQSSITIKKGGSVTLVDDVATTHIIENGMWDPQTGTERPKIEPNAPKVDVQIAGSGNQHTIGPFNTAGTFHLYCTVHPGMNLTVIVQYLYAFSLDKRV
jgi:plastocyanin